MFNLTGRKYSDGMVTREITRQTNYGITVEIVADRADPNNKFPPQDYSWEQLIAMCFGPMVTEDHADQIPWLDCGEDGRI